MSLPDDPDVKAAVEAVGHVIADVAAMPTGEGFHKLAIEAVFPHLERYFRKQFEKQEAAVKRMLSE